MGRILPPRDWPDAERSAIDELQVSPTTGTITRVKFANRVQVEEKLARLRGVFQKREQDVHPMEALLQQLPRETVDLLYDLLGQIVDGVVDLDPAPAAPRPGIPEPRIVSTPEGAMPDELDWGVPLEDLPV